MGRTVGVMLAVSGSFDCEAEWCLCSSAQDDRFVAAGMRNRFLATLGKDRKATATAAGRDDQRQRLSAQERAKAGLSRVEERGLRLEESGSCR
jgi:hypothetical protein